MQELLERKKGLHRKILIVDDEFIEREMLGEMLKDLYEISYAENGALALEIIKSEKQRLSLIILDLHMPELDGYSLLKYIRSDSDLRRIPVIVLTSEKDAEVKSLQLGAADFITKPYDLPDVIRARVKHSIELAENSIIIHETERDELTGLFNKEFFFEYGKILDNQNEILMDALVLDVNRFHIINELYGKAYGDLVLKKIGSFIHNIVNTKEGGLACRSESNCFCIYLPHSDDLKIKLQSYISQVNEVIIDHKISIRIGIYLDDGSSLNMEEKFDRAKLACQKLRSTYSTAFDFYDEKLHSKELRLERLVNDFNNAIKEKQFKVFYQPKYNILKEKAHLTSCEALVRWFHPEFGLISPFEFISLFEENGLIQDLDRYVWAEAASKIKEWKDKYSITIPISVNVSRIDIFNPNLENILDELLKNNSIQSKDLLLEITESAYTDNSKQIIETINNLRNKGFMIEMDDFGNGYSSLNMLTTLPIDALKLDMKFIKNICLDKKSCRLVEIMIEISKMLEVPVIAEGVETKEQLDLLKEMGCDIVQGYYFSKPIPDNEFEELIKKEIRG